MGAITGSFTADEARAMVLQLRYGALPVPLAVSRAVGPTLGRIGGKGGSGGDRVGRRAVFMPSTAAPG